MEVEVDYPWLMVDTVGEERHIVVVFKSDVKYKCEGSSNRSQIYSSFKGGQ